MPKGPRGSRGKPHSLVLSVKVIQVPKGVTRDHVRRALLMSIGTGSYSLPRDWIVQLGWGNHGAVEKWDEWSNAMADSTQGGRGWDSAVRRYVERMR